MAYAAIVSLAQTTDLVLNHDKYYLYGDEREEIKSIREYVIFLISYLEDFPGKAKGLEGQIRKIANEAEDIIEQFMWTQIQSPDIRLTLSRVEFELQLKKVGEEIGLILGELMDDRPGDLPAAVSSSQFVPTSKRDDAVVGLDDDLEVIMERLCGESSKLEVIPIVGMAGIGKTTLARNAYSDSLIMERFEIRAWITVSQDYSVKEMFSRLLDSVKLFEKQMVEKEDEDETDCTQEMEEKMRGSENEFLTAEKVYKILKGRRFLIVMDDVWSTKTLDDVRNIFPDDHNWSRILITTRLSDVATYADSAGRPIHEMKFMADEQSWNLLKQKVFAGSNEQFCPLELSDVGKDIARSCKGLPLAVVLVAGILSTVTKTRASWEEIAENFHSITDESLEKILSLSYTHLPHHLRPCLLFLGGFPEDHKICLSKLIKLWVAEGFLKHHIRYKCLEEMAEEYLEELVKRSLVLVASRKSNGKIKSCSLHDLVRDLCIRRAQEDNFLLHVTDNVLPKSLKNKRRISINRSHLNNIEAPTMHTILCLQLDDFPSFLAFVGSFRLLRVLDAVSSNLRLLPPQLFELFHLRYLALRNPERIPSAISRLENLQTLIFNAEAHLWNSYLPSGIWRMRRLRHLIFPYCYNLPDPYEDESTLHLEDLRTLSAATGLVCSERIVRRIPNLKKLGVIYTDNKDYHLHNLRHLYLLEKLKITMYKYSSWRGKRFAFPTTLKKLTLSGGQLPWKNMAVVGSLPNLEVLKLRDAACGGATWETSDGEFPQLKFLLIAKSHLEHWITESSHFPRLKSLVLHKCPRLGEIPNSIGDIPTLELIEVDGISLLESAYRIQEEQQSYENYTLQVRRIYSPQDYFSDLIPEAWIED